MRKILLSLLLLAMPATANAVVCANGDRLENEPAYAADKVRQADFYGWVERLPDVTSPEGTHEVLKVLYPGTEGSGAERTIVLAAPRRTPDGSGIIVSDAEPGIRVEVGDKLYVALSRDEAGRFHAGACLMIAAYYVQESGLFGDGG